MKRLAALALAIVLVESVFGAESTSRVLTRPAVPSKDALAALSLKLGWRSYLPVDGTRDGIFSVQLFGNQVLVQLRSGAIIALDAETGGTQWQTRVGSPYKVNQSLAANYNTIVGYSLASVFGLDRATGDVVWHADLPNAPSGPAAVDLDQVYIPLTGSRLATYRLPTKKTPEDKEREKEAALEKEKDKDKPTVEARNNMASPYAPRSQGISAVGPLNSTSLTQGTLERQRLPLAWDYLASGRLEYAPLLVPKTDKQPGFVLLVASDGTMTAGYKEAHDILYRSKAERPIAASIGQHGGTAYIPFEDNNVTALDVDSARILWRFAAGGPIRQRPEVTDEDMFVVGSRSGLSRVKRTTGDLVWRNADAERFVASNKKWVYALDRVGNLLVLDRARGTKQGSLDMRGFTLAVGNDRTDRLYLASNDGLIICLHDKDQTLPLSVKQVAPEVPEAPVKKAPAAEPKMKEPEPKKEEKKE